MFARHRSTVVVTAAVEAAAVSPGRRLGGCSRDAQVSPVMPGVGRSRSYRGQGRQSGTSSPEQPPATEVRAPVHHTAERWIAGPSAEQVDFGLARRRALRRVERADPTLAVFVKRLTVVGAVITLFAVAALMGWHVTRQSQAAAHQPAQPAVQSMPATDSADTLQMGKVSLGVPAVDYALGAFLTGDVGAAVSQLVVRHITCGTIPSEGTPVLPCAATERPGTVHEVVLSACTPRWLPVEAARLEVATLLTDTPGLVAVTTFASSYTAVLSWPNAPDRSLVLTITSLGVTSYGSTCGPPTAPTFGRPVEAVALPGS
jgi:hypothetical protein